MPLPTLRIIDRYLARELLSSFIAATAILLLVVIGATIGEVLNDIARGKVPADLLFQLIGLNTIGTLNVLIPLAIFLGVQIAYGRLYRESEMAVFQASGLPLSGLLRPLALMGLPLVVCMGLISFWIAPAAKRMTNDVQTKASRSLIVAGLEPGKFVPLPSANGDGAMYVQAMNEDGTRIKKVFIASEKANATSHVKQINVITAADGELYHDVNGTERYLRLNDGFRVEGVLGQDNYRLIRYERNDAKLDDNGQDSSAGSTASALTTTALLQSADPGQRAEIQWRLVAPLSIVVLVLLALPLSKSSPRQPRYASLLIALLSWAIYFALLNIAHAMLRDGRHNAVLGFLAIHVPTVLVAVYLILRSQQLPKPKTTKTSSLAAGAG